MISEKSEKKTGEFYINFFHQKNLSDHWNFLFFVEILALRNLETSNSLLFTSSHFPDILGQ